MPLLKRRWILGRLLYKKKYIKSIETGKKRILEELKRFKISGDSYAGNIRAIIYEFLICSNLVTSDILKHALKYFTMCLKNGETVQ